MKQCKVCGASDRNASGGCRPCQRKRSKAWSERNREAEQQRKRELYLANREAVIQRSAAWVAANADHVRAYKSAWREKNRDKERGYSVAWRTRHPQKRAQVIRAWEARNPDAAKRRNINRRARMANAPGRPSPGLAARLLKLQRGMCACCGLPLGNDYHLDHIVPLALGGENHDSNFQLLRKRCNLSKQAKHPIDYMQQKGKLL